MARVMLTLSYDGAAFYGFESQTDKRTVQGVLNNALIKLYNAPISVTASGRTDAGVHALGQVVHYDAEKDIDCGKIKSALNFYLPPDIRITAAQIRGADFNARKSAKRKTYRYDIYLSETDNPLLNNRAWRLGGEVNTAVMKTAAALFEGAHDFKEFYCLGSSAKTTTREIYECVITETEIYGEKVLSIRVTANGFLYKMVRLITGAIAAAGQNKITPANIAAMLNNEKKNTKKIPAPACGLYLEKVEYQL